MARKSSIIIAILIVFFAKISDCQITRFMENGAVANFHNAAINKFEIEDKKPAVPPDKIKHFLGSLMSTVLIAKTAQKQFEMKGTDSKKLGVAVSFGLGIGKELYDGQKPDNSFSWKDILADLSGVAVGLILLNQP